MPSPPASPTCISPTKLFPEQVAGAEFLFRGALWYDRRRIHARGSLFGGGQALWDEVDAQFNIKPLMAAKYRRADGRAGSTRRSTARRISRGCAIGCRNSAPRSCAAWAPPS